MPEHNNTEFPPMRTQDEVQRAHDMIVSFLLEMKEADVLDDLPKEYVDEMKRSANALCWVLNHNHNDSFGALLAHVHKLARRFGMELVEDTDSERRSPK